MWLWDCCSLDWWCLVRTSRLTVTKCEAYCKQPDIYEVPNFVKGSRASMNLNCARNIYLFKLKQICLQTSSLPNWSDIWSLLALRSPCQGKTRSGSLCGIWIGRPLTSHITSVPPLSHFTAFLGGPVIFLPPCQGGAWNVLARLGAPMHILCPPLGSCQPSRCCQVAGSRRPPSPAQPGHLPSLPHCFLLPSPSGNGP